MLESTVCDKVALGLGNEIAITYDKIRYLGNNEFDIEKLYEYKLSVNELNLYIEALWHSDEKIKPLIM